MTKAPVLTLPDFAKPFVLQTDAWGIGIGLFTFKGYIIYLILVKNSALNYKIYQLMFVNYMPSFYFHKCGHYLLCRNFTVRTDQKSLKELMSQVIQIPNQHYYLTRPLGYDYSIVYKPGRTNQVANALSR